VVVVVKNCRLANWWFPIGTLLNGDAANVRRKQYENIRNSAVVGQQWNQAPFRERERKRTREGNSEEAYFRHDGIHESCCSFDKVDWRMTYIVEIAMIEKNKQPTTGKGWDRFLRKHRAKLMRKFSNLMEPAKYYKIIFSFGIDMTPDDPMDTWSFCLGYWEIK
jgi:hypothetical protein